MHILIDIDGTVATRNDAVFVDIANRRLKLEIPSHLEAMQYAEFLARSETLVYKASVGQAKFDYAMAWIALDPAHLRECAEVAGASEGAWRLAEFGDIWYYTCRKVPAIPSLSTKIALATAEWLESRGFPWPSQVVFCDDPGDKLSRIADLEEQAVLIDDSYASLLNAYDRLDTSTRNQLQKTLTLYAFGAENIEHSELRCVALPSWQCLESTPLLRKEEGTYGRQR